MKNSGVYARASDGRFAKGTAPGPGRPAQTVLAELHAAMDEVVTSERWRRIIDKAATDAEAGDRHAREWLSLFRFGKPREMPELDTAAEPSEPPKVVLLDWRNKTLPTNGEDHAQNN